MTVTISSRVVILSFAINFIVVVPTFTAVIIVLLLVDDIVFLNVAIVESVIVNVIFCFAFDGKTSGFNVNVFPITNCIFLPLGIDIFVGCIEFTFIVTGSLVLNILIKFTVMLNVTVP